MFLYNFFLLELIRIKLDVIFPHYIYFFSLKFTRTTTIFTANVNDSKCTFSYYINIIHRGKRV